MIFNQFPREIGFPKRIIIHYKKDFLKIINRNNTKNNIIFSVYAFEDTQINYGRESPDYQTAIVDKIFFDFDEEDCSLDMKKFHKYLMKKDLKHCVFFSGRGYHIYIFCNPNIINKQNTILRIQKHFKKKLNIRVDEQTFGNLAQMGRVPNTYNLKRRRFCIPLSEDDLKLTHEEIREKAKQQVKNFSFNKIPIFSTKILKTKNFDSPPRVMKGDLETEDIKIKDCNIKIKDAPPCISKVLKDSNAGYRQRGLLITYLREKNYTLEETEKILESFLNKKKWEHCKRTEKQVPRLYRTTKYLLPKCERLMEEGFCPGRCSKFNKVIYI